MSALHEFISSALADINLDSSAFYGAAMFYSMQDDFDYDVVEILSDFQSISFDEQRMGENCPCLIEDCHDLLN